MDNGPTTPPQPLPVIVMRITLDQATGQLQVEGIPPSPLVAYGMLELAKDVVRSLRQRKVEQSRILAPGPGVKLI
jgi:hypothetical protein